MDLSAALTKTAKGHDEIASRRHRLPFRVRTMLIMVDGRRTGDELVRHSVFGAQAQEHLSTLLAERYVEPLTAIDEARALNDITLSKRYVVQMLHELLGADANAFVPIIEQATSAAQLLHSLEQLREPLITGAGQQKADEFWEKLSLVLV